MKQLAVIDGVLPDQNRKILCPASPEEESLPSPEPTSNTTTQMEPAMNGAEEAELQLQTARVEGHKGIVRDTDAKDGSDVMENPDGESKEMS